MNSHNIWIRGDIRNMRVKKISVANIENIFIVQKTTIHSNLSFLFIYLFIFIFFYFLFFIFFYCFIYFYFFFVYLFIYFFKIGFDISRQLTRR